MTLPVIENTVILSYQDHSTGNYEYKVITTGNSEESRSHAYVHIDCESMDDFDGFSLDEKKKLKEMGVTHITLIGYLHPKSVYVILTDWTLLNQLKLRNTDQHI